MIPKADHISIKASESRLKERNEELFMILELSNFLSASVHLQAILDGALSQILEHFHLDAGRIYLLHPSGQFLTLAACKGMNPKGLERIKVSEGFSGLAVRTRSFIAQFVSELEDRQMSDFLSHDGFLIVVCIPLIVRDKIIGVMNLATRRMIELHQEEIDLLIATGNQVAIAANHTKIFDDLEKKKEMIERFTYSAAHDLKSPAIGAYGLARLLQKQYGNALEEKGMKYCDQIMKTTGEIVTLIEDIKSYVAARESALDIAAVSLKEVAEVIHNEFAQALGERNIKWIEPGAVETIRADRVLILRALQNLVDNALKYGGEDLSEIKIGYHDDKDSCILSVSDNGIGIAKEDCERLFQAFQRGKTSKETEGTGLGLAIVMEVAERHHGRAWAEARPEIGTTFYLSISKIDSLLLSSSPRGFRNLPPFSKLDSE
jgi:signal transduction histidine kinase